MGTLFLIGLGIGLILTVLLFDTVTA